MKRLLVVVLFLYWVPNCFAQGLTHEQKTTDFLSLAGRYDKNYGPNKWKLEAFDYDLRELEPWLAQVNASTDDLSFYDICVRYVASLHDFHDEFILPSFYEPFLPFTVDIYDGKVLIDSINQIALPPGTFQFAVGDELVSVDGVSVGNWITALGPYAVNGQGNPVSRNRIAAALILDRYQGFYTFANKVKPGDTATIAVKNHNGHVATYPVPWQVIGVPLDREGPVPNPSISLLASMSPSAENVVKRSLREHAKAATNPWGIWTGASAPRELRSAPDYMEPLQRLRNMSHFKPDHVVAGSIFPFDSPFPVFNPPPGFQLRLGGNQTDEFLSGTLPVGNLTIGFIRIPSFAPASLTNALQQFQGEITYFQQNTDGLVIDLMSNGGGDLCYSNNVLQYLIPKPFRSIGLAVRPTEEWVLAFEAALLNAEFSGGSQTTINLLTGYLDEVQDALEEGRGLTRPLPVCTDSLTYPPATDDQGNNLAYTKPIVVLTDNFTASAAEFFTATLQDAKRVTVYGVRTSGGGGNVVQYDATVYSEGNSRVTLSLGVRNHDISSRGLPTAPYIENIGVLPEITADYQTRDNLLNGGQTFVNGFSAAISKLIASGHP